MKENWEVKKLGDILIIERGGSPRPIDSFITDSPDGINWIKIGDTKGITKYISETKEKIKPEGARRSRMVYEGDFILSNSMSFGRPYIMKTTGCIHDGWLLLRARENNINPDFLYHLLGSPLIFKQFDNLAAGSTVRNLNIDLVKSVQIPLPPLPEQQRIVAILDEAFAAVAKAKENAAKNLQNAREIFDSYLHSIFANPVNAWNTKQFGDLIELLTDYHANGGYSTLKENVELKNTEDYAWMVRSTDFENNFTNDFRYVSKSSYEFLRKSKVFGGEIIISKIGNAGKVYLMPPIDRPCSLAMNLFLIRVDEEKASPEYLYQYLNSKYGEAQISSRLNGATTKTITKDNIRNINIPVPPISEQQEIVSKLETLSAETQKLENIYRQKINDLDELKKSILQKAFAGELQ